MDTSLLENELTVLGVEDPNWASPLTPPEDRGAPTGVEEPNVPPDTTDRERAYKAVQGLSRALALLADHVQTLQIAAQALEEVFEPPRTSPTLGESDNAPDTTDPS